MPLPRSLYLRLGSQNDGDAHGDQVSQVQTALNESSIMVDYPVVPVTGIFDAATDAGVREYQKRVFPNQWKEWDGIVGPKTLGFLFQPSDTARRFPGHPGLQDGEGTFLTLSPPDDPFFGQAKLAFEDAIRNPYCYEFLAAALQFDFKRNRWFPAQIVGN